MITPNAEKKPVKYPPMMSEKKCIPFTILEVPIMKAHKRSRTPIPVKPDKRTLEAMAELLIA